MKIQFSIIKCFFLFCFLLHQFPEGKKHSVTSVFENHLQLFLENHGILKTYQFHCILKNIPLSIFLYLVFNVFDFFRYQVLGKKIATSAQGKGCTDMAVQEMVQQHKTVSFFFFYFLSKIRFLLFIFIRMSKFKNFVKKTREC